MIFTSMVLITSLILWMIKKKQINLNLIGYYRDFIFYNNNSWENGIIQLKESNDSTINSTFKFYLKRIPNNISKIAITATIYDYKSKNQNFSLVKNMFIRGREKGTNTDIFHFDLDDFLSLETGLIIGEIYKYNGYWKFNAVASGYTEIGRAHV